MSLIRYSTILLMCVFGTVLLYILTRVPPRRNHPDT